MKTKLLTLIGALLIISSSAMGTEPDNNSSGSNSAGQKPEGVCDCNTTKVHLSDKKRTHDPLLNHNDQSSAPADSGNATKPAGTQ